VNSWDDEELASLRFHWGSAYEITCPARRAWMARRRDDLLVILRARDAGDLLELIRRDYQASPVPR
jgi:hypothetical protein